MEEKGQTAVELLLVQPGEFLLVPLGPDAGGSVYRQYSEPGDIGAHVVPFDDTDDEQGLADFIPEPFQKCCSKKTALVFASLLSAGMGFGYMAAGPLGLGIGAAVSCVVFGIGKKCTASSDLEFNSSQPDA
jgi:hypothetical protein